MRIHELRDIVHNTLDSNPAILPMRVLSEFLCADFPFGNIGNNSGILLEVRHRFGLRYDAMRGLLFEILFCFIAEKSVVIPAQSVTIY